MTALGCSARTQVSRALPRSDNGEGGPALFYLMTAAVRTGNPAFLMVCERQKLRECFLAGTAEELVVGHGDLPRLGGSKTDASGCPESRIWGRKTTGVCSSKISKSHSVLSAGHVAGAKTIRE